MSHRLGHAPPHRYSLLLPAEQNVLNNTLDLGFIGSPAKDDRLVAGKLFDDELVLVLPADHRWRNRRTIQASEIVGEPFLVSQAGSGTRATLEERFQNAGITPRMIELGHTESIKRAVESGLGISILSKSVVKRELKYGWLKTARLSGINLERKFYYIYRKGKYLSKAARSFLWLTMNSLGKRNPANKRNYRLNANLPC